MIDVRTFGGFSIWQNDKALHQGLGLGGRGLAAFLFVHPGKIYRREKLLDLFWGELSERRARRAMNTALWRLRAILAGDQDGCCRESLRSEAGEIVMMPSETVAVDAQDLEGCVQRLWGDLGHRQLSLERDDRRALECALDCYQGPFLEDFSDGWVMEARERLHCVYIRGLTLLMAHYAAKGHYEEALDAARRILAIDPLRETVQRHAMRLYVLNGQRAEAIRQFERCGALLKEECDVDPMPQTVELRDHIASGAVFAHLEAEESAVIAARISPHD